MKRLRNVNNRGSVVSCRRPVRPRVEPTSVDEGNGFLTVAVRWVSHWYGARFPVYNTYRVNSQNTPSRRRTCNYKRMISRRIKDTSTSKITRKIHL